MNNSSYIPYPFDYKHNRISYISIADFQMTKNAFILDILNILEKFLPSSAPEAHFWLICDCIWRFPAVLWALSTLEIFTSHYTPLCCRSSLFFNKFASIALRDWIQNKINYFPSLRSSIDSYLCCEVLSFLVLSPSSLISMRLFPYLLKETLW